jgi:hypothetical protein
MLNVQKHWREKGPKVLDDVAKKSPTSYFNGMVAMCKVVRWEFADMTQQQGPMSAEHVGQTGGTRWSKGPQAIRKVLP